MINDLTNKIRFAVEDMYDRVIFVDENNQHRYETIDGKWLQGVSSVSSIIPKDWLSAWGAKEAVKALGYSDYPEDTQHAKDVLEVIKACKSVEEYIKILKSAKGSSARKSKEALVDGKAGHAWLEDYVKAQIRGKELPKLPEGNLERPIKQFLEWEAKEVDYWILSEARVCYPEKEYAGTLDALAMMKNGKLAVIDFKFASNISEDYYLQLAGYAATFEPYGIKIDVRIIVRLPKTLTKDEWSEKDRTYSKVENTIEVEVVKTDYEVDKQVFFNCLPVKAWINTMENRKI